MNDILKDLRRVYFVGIGGIGMSALARYFKANGYAVAGYDKTLSPLTEQMREREGIEIVYVDDVAVVSDEYKKKEDMLVVYTPAVPADSRLLSFFRESGFELHKRSEILGLLSKSGKALCVAGTHGKTTVSTMLAYLLNCSSVGCSAFLGGISMNFGSNLLINKQSEYIVVEADEFDRSFLHLEPEMAVITAMDDDHLDIYGTRENLLEAFAAFAGKVRKTGRLFVKKGLELKSAQVTGFYDVEEKTDFYSDNLRIEHERYVFDYHGETEILGVTLGVPGRVNVENATAAITMALAAGVKESEIREALPGFRGVVRRFNIHTEGKVMYIDDYAHHPKEIEAVLSSVRQMWGDKRLTVIFQPHLYSRTQDFYKEFAQSLSLADEVILLDIYPARELPIEGVTSGLILDNLTVPGQILTREELPVFVKEGVTSGILMTLGAGDIDRFVNVFTEICREKR